MAPIVAVTYRMPPILPDGRKEMSSASAWAILWPMAEDSSPSELDKLMAQKRICKLTADEYLKLIAAAQAAIKAMPAPK